MIDASQRAHSSGFAAAFAPTDPGTLGSGRDGARPGALVARD